MIVAGWITTRTGHYKAQIVIGFGLWAIAQGVLSTVGVHSDMGKLIAAMVLGGTGAGLTFQTMLLASGAAVQRHEQAVLAGVRMFFRACGTTLGLAIDGSHTVFNAKSVPLTYGEQPRSSIMSCVIHLGRSTCPRNRPKLFLTIPLRLIQPY